MSLIELLPLVSVSFSTYESFLLGVEFPDELLTFIDMFPDELFSDELLLLESKSEELFPLLVLFESIELLLST